MRDSTPAATRSAAAILAGAPPLAEVLADVLGDLAFMVADDQPADFATGTVWFEGEVRYGGPARGRLRLWCTREFATRLAANLLGIEPEEGNARVGAEDAVREFMNVLCGQLVTAWYGREAVIHLGIPAAGECMQRPAQPDPDAYDRCLVSIDGEPLLCTCRLEN